MFRFFNPKLYIPGSDEYEDIWNMGETINCKVLEDNITVEVEIPDGFDGNLPFKVTFDCEKIVNFRIIRNFLVCHYAFSLL